MKIAFRADASTQIGTGHVMRCLTLAHALKDKGAVVHFICRDHKGSLVNFIREQGFICKKLTTKNISCLSIDGANDSLHATWLGADFQTDANQTKMSLANEKLDWLIVDHYALDYRWERTMRNYCLKIMVIDDLLDRHHDCDLILDQTYGRRDDAYRESVPDTCKQLLGSSYALLRPEFANSRRESLKRLECPEQKHILISLGGIDKDNITSRILDALKVVDLINDCRITVVMSSAAPWLDQVTDKAVNMPWATSVKVDVSNMAQLMTDSDLGIGAAGTTTWERCCLGLPSIVISLADNQAEILSTLEKQQAIIHVSKENIQREIEYAFTALIENQEKLINNSLSICDGLGVYRVLQYFEDLPDKDGNNTSLRLAKKADIELVYEWQQLPETRAYSRNNTIPSLKEHTQWMTYKLSSLDCYFYIIQKGNIDVGVIKIDRVELNTYEISIYIIPDVFGKGVASNAIARLKSIHRNNDIIAIVLPNNKASQKLFLSNRFAPLDAETFLFNTHITNE